MAPIRASPNNYVKEDSKSKLRVSRVIQSKKKLAFANNFQNLASKWIRCFLLSYLKEGQSYCHFSKKKRIRRFESSYLAPNAAT
jgi:hypothetical protein